MPKPIQRISVRGLCKKFGDMVVLDHIDLDLNENESLVIIGGSGTGKSVLIKCILGLIPYDSGTILINGQDISKLSVTEKDKLYSHIGMLFQGGALFDSMTVWENIAFGLIQGQRMPVEQAKDIAFEKLEAVGLKESAGYSYPAQLSGGMQKRVALARAIAIQPEIIFFDEPTTGLDPIVSGTINELIKKCVKDVGTSTITITHDMNSVATIGDRVGLLHQGKIIWSGTIDEMKKTKDPYVHQFIHGLPKGPFTTGIKK